MPQTDWLRVTIEGIRKDITEIKEHVKTFDAQEIKDIKADVKELNKAHWISQGKTIGVAAVVAFLVSLLGLIFKN